MTEETRCPACGAPLVFSGTSNVVRCGFCGTDLKMTEKDGHTHFRVLSQPEPQKEVLDQPVEMIDDFSGGVQAYPAVDPGSSAVGEPFPSQPMSSGAVVYPVEGGAQGLPRRTISRWVWVAIAMLVGLGLFCICAIMVVLAIIPSQMH
jgi:hypothetical protein